MRYQNTITINLGEYTFFVAFCGINTFNSYVLDFCDLSKKHKDFIVEEFANEIEKTNNDLSISLKDIEDVSYEHSYNYEEPSEGSEYDGMYENDCNGKLYDFEEVE